MLSRKATMFLLIIQIHILQAISQTINIRDTRVFEIALDDANYDEESENEMIQSVDLADLKPLAEDESRYEPLHSHVKYYNEHNAESKKQYSDILLSLQPHTKEIFNLEEEDKLFIAGFKHNLDKYFSKMAKQITSIPSINHTDKNKKSMQTSARLQNYRKNRANVATVKSVKSIRVKRKEIENHYETTMNEETDFFQVIRNRNVTTDETETTEYFMKTQRTQYDLYEYKETTNEDTKDTLDQISILERGFTSPVDNESSYEDSERFKMEYEQQLEYDIKEGKVLNYTEMEEPKDTPRRALKRIMDLKRSENCTKEKLSQIGIKAIECLLYDFQRTKDITTAKMVLSRTWLVLRIWILIYICLAIPCWCQRGWCCCCFRCKFCFPRKRIILVKQYYAMNPPGVFMKDLKKEKDVKREEPIRYEATKYEYNAYKALETAIRNI